MNEIPRGPEGQETLPDTSKYQQILQRIEGVLAADNAEGAEQFVRERLAELASQSQAREIGMMTNKFHKGFIHPDSGVRRTYIVDPVHIDDEGLYRELLGTFRELKKTPGWENRTLREIVPSTIQHTIGKYFGNAVADPDSEARNREFYLDKVSPEESPRISIKDFRGQRMAVCVEKAAAAQNLLNFVGIESSLVMSSKCRIPEEGKEEGHAYNVFSTEKGNFIYDPANPRQQGDEEGRLVSIAPGMYRITREELEGLHEGKSVTVEHKDTVLGSDGAVVKEDMHNRVYAG